MKKKKGTMERWLDGQLTKTKKEVHRQLSKEDLVLISILAIIVAILQVTSMLLNMFNWAQNPEVNFNSYHLYAPLVGLVGWIGYSIVLVAKRVHALSILPYVPAVIGILYNLILTFIRFSIISPEILRIW